MSDVSSLRRMAAAVRFALLPIAATGMLLGSGGASAASAAQTAVDAAKPLCAGGSQQP